MPAVVFLIQGSESTDVLAYDAACKAVAAALLMTGHRVRSRPGSHQALAQYAKVLVGENGEPALE